MARWVVLKVKELYTNTNHSYLYCKEVQNLAMFSECYVPLKTLHITLVLASGALFTLRGVAGLSGRGWGMAQGVRRLSYALDTLLLLAGVGLWLLLSLNPLQQTWLGVKLLLLLLYIALGSLALKRARSPRGRMLSFVATLCCYGFMLTVARAHHPLGWWA